jgi:hypothetical protein
MKQILKVLLFILLNLAELVVILLSLAIFTSPFPMFSWYEPDSIEFLGIFLLSIALHYSGWTCSAGVPCRRWA